MTYLVERLEDLRRHLDHLMEIRSNVRDASSLEEDFTLHNDVLFSLLMVTQLVVDVAGELSARRNLTIRSYRHAVENRGAYVIEALSDLDPVERFLKICSAMELEEG